MSPETKRKVARAVGCVLASTPLGFGALRALTTGTDFRYIVTAFVSVAAAGLTFRLGAGPLWPTWRRPIFALAVSTVAGAMAAFSQGASSAAAVGTVAGAFGICVTVGGMLGAYSAGAV